MRLLARRNVQPVVGGKREAYPRRLNEREAEIATLQFLVTSIATRHKWDRIKCTIATGIPVFWIVTIAVSLAIAGFQWHNLINYQRHVIPLVQAMYERAIAKRDRELLTMLGNVLRIGKLTGFLRSLFSTSKGVGKQGRR